MSYDLKLTEKGKSERSYVIESILSDVRALSHQGSECPSSWEISKGARQIEEPALGYYLFSHINLTPMAGACLLIIF